MQPFAPPEEASDTAVGTGPVVGTWAGAGMALGTALGLALGASGLLGMLVPMLVGLCGAGVVGLAVAHVDHLVAQSRPAEARLPGLTRLWVMGSPIALTVLALFASAALGGQRSGASLPALGLAVLALGLTYLWAPLYSRRALARAVLAAQQGREEVARAGFVRVSTSILASRRQRAVAMLNLGRLDLSTGSPDGALEAFAAIEHQQVRPWAATGAALACLMADQEASAGPWMEEASGVCEVRAELDALRILLTWRTEGEGAARVLAEALVEEGAAGTLSVGLLVALRRRAGLLEGARRLSTPQLLEDLGEGPGAYIRELAPLLGPQTQRPRQASRAAGSESAESG